MNNNEINYLINELSNLQITEGWKIMLNHITETFNILSDNLDEINSKNNEIKYNQYDIIRHDKLIYKWMINLIPTIIQEYQNMKTPEEDFKQV